MNIENASNNIDDQDPSEDGAADDELQMEQESGDETESSELDEPAADQQMSGITGEEFQGALSSVGEAVRQVGESSDWESESERLIRKVTDNAGQMG
jgi:NADPH-dependent glutamate synthase beta subunit-like oxidoreductase